MTTEVTIHDRAHLDFIERMERTRLAYQRGYTCFYDGIPEFALTSRERWVRDTSRPLGWRDVTEKMKSERRPIDKSQPKPLDLRVYEFAKSYNPKLPQPKLMAAFVKERDAIHPDAKRYLIERMRKAEARHRDMAKRYGDIADQFETGSNQHGGK